MNLGIITGASSGIGREFALQLTRLSRNLDQIWIIARREKKLIELKNELQAIKVRKNPDFDVESFVRILVLDLRDEDAFHFLQRELKLLHPRILFLVNAAGFGIVTSVSASDRAQENSMIKTNVMALTNMTKICLPHLCRGASIFQIASAAAFMPQPGFTSYAATKAFVLSYSRALRAELKSHRIFVTAVCPGPVDTEFFTVAGSAAAESGYKKFFFAQAENVVRCAISDRKKGISVYGTPMRIFYLLSKILPHSLLINIAAFFSK